MNNNYYLKIMENQTITLTFCDQAENHVGMQQLGNKSMVGFDLTDLIKAKKWFNENGVETTIIDLNYPIEKMDIYPDDEAYILIARSAIDYIIGPNYNAIDFFEEQVNLVWDTKAFMYGRVVNKHARYNLCFGPNAQEPKYKLRKGTIVPFDDVPILSKFKDMLPIIIGPKAKNMVVEGNYYYDKTKCGIGYHGDGERKKVIGVRLGATIPLVYQWYLNSKPVGSPIRLVLNHGDIYIMSEKATGNDWKKKNIYTLRHAAGSKKFIEI